ncbi:biotin transporter BioY [Chthonobacter rhizosphaerae]|uniref:biotin transporter BioY n=1 Tax=Chthonobacter rhizosphaerae TaxID=2735553 RepID=UPI0015EEE262|nr:biotin transporter BioY [Chthonobacter rhizosphaerae]
MTTRDLVLVALFTALVVALGAVPGIPVAALPVPIVLQNLGIILAGAVLGAWRGAAVAALLVVLVAIGLPVLSGGRGGLGVLGGPTGGFILGWIPAAFVTGLVAERIAPVGSPLGRTFLGVGLGGLLGGIVIDYAAGIAWLLAMAPNEAGLPLGERLAKTTLGMAVFIPGDLVKIALAGVITHALGKAYPIARR